MSATFTQLACSYCGNHHHGVMCPRIKAIEYNPRGSIKRMEFHDPQGWPLGPVGDKAGSNRGD